MKNIKKRFKILDFPENQLHPKSSLDGLRDEHGKIRLPKYPFEDSYILKPNPKYEIPKNPKP